MQENKNLIRIGTSPMTPAQVLVDLWPRFQQQKTAHEYMRKYGVQHESWGPFAEGRKDFFTNPVLTEIGKKYNKSAAQTALRFLLQKDVV